jgi:hypothetical protein
LLTDLAAIGTVRPVTRRHLGDRLGGVETDEAQQAVVSAAADLCAIAFDEQVVDPATGTPMVHIDAGTGHTCRFLVPATTVASAPPRVPFGGWVAAARPVVVEA